MNCLPHSCSSQINSLNKEVCNHFTPEIVFHGSSQEGTISIIEYLTKTPLASLFSTNQHSNFILEIYFRPKQFFQNETNRVEVIETETHQVLIYFNIDSNLNHIYNLISSSDEVRQNNSKSLTLRIHLFEDEPNSSFLNVVYFPLESQTYLTTHISEKNHQSFYCFVLDSNTSLRTATITTGFVNQIDKVIIIKLFIINQFINLFILFISSILSHYSNQFFILIIQLLFLLLILFHRFETTLLSYSQSLVQEERFQMKKI